MFSGIISSPVPQYFVLGGCSLSAAFFNRMNARSNKKYHSGAKARHSRYATSRNKGNTTSNIAGSADAIMVIGSHRSRRLFLVAEGRFPLFHENGIRIAKDLANLPCPFVPITSPL